MKLLFDLHTHTVASGHAFSTLKENIEEAAAKGLKAMGTSDHYSAMPGSAQPIYFTNFKAIKEKILGVRIFTGMEANIIDLEGKLDAEEAVLKKMDYVIASLHVPCVKTTSAFLCLEKDAVSEAQKQMTACINCGRCVHVCPGRVLPARLATLAERGDMAGFEKLNGMECCECGCCSFVCPAKRPLTQEIKSMRKIQLASRRKK